MLTKFRPHKFKCSLILLTVASLAVEAAHAQPQTPPTSSQTPIFDITPTDARHNAFNVHFKGVATAALLEELAKQGGKKILFSDEMRVRLAKPQFEVEFQDIPLIDLVNALSRLSNFSWGSMGDTWLIVPTQTPPIQEAPMPPVLHQIPNPTPKAPEYLWPPSFKAAPSRTPPNGQPFQFNGGTYYIVPLTPTKAAEAQ